MDLTPLYRFTRRVTELKARVPYAADTVLRGVREHLQYLVQQTYGDAVITVISQDRANNVLTAVLDIHAQDLWYREFGTGYVGQSSAVHWEYLPTVDLSFFSRGEMQHTHGWEYAYHPDTKAKGYWVYRGQIHYGEPALNGVSNAIIRIQYEGIPNLATWLREYL
ncbi:MAG: hypothetical protein J5662_01280 [Clostridia bacterium]|nr:hypothetical protein [Clostridia bacterium]